MKHFMCFFMTAFCVFMTIGCSKPANLLPDMLNGEKANHSTDKISEAEAPPAQSAPAKEADNKKEKIKLADLITVEDISAIASYEVILNQSMTNDDMNLGLKFKELNDSALSIFIATSNASIIYESDKNNKESRRVVKEIEGLGQKAMFYEHNNGIKALVFVHNDVYVQISIGVTGSESKTAEAIAEKSEEILNRIARKLADRLDDL